MGACIPYPAIERHGLIGDRRTAALVAADGTLDWLCLPDYDSAPAFGALLDARTGGFWRVGPRALRHGAQRYPGLAPILETRWHTREYDLELTDCMALPAADGDPDDAAERVVLRRLTCTRGRADCVVVCRPAPTVGPITEAAPPSGGARLSFWASRRGVGVQSEVSLAAGDRLWMAVSWSGSRRWSVDHAEQLLAGVHAFWSEIVTRLGGDALDPRLARSAVTIRLLEYARCGSLVAAPTTSLPERIGGGWNADYRLTWVRDASLSMQSLARLGDLDSASRYLDWLAGLERGGATGPLQVLYTIRGGRAPVQSEQPDRAGYRDSRPVRVGNHAFRQQQLDIFGYLADCLLTYVERGGWLRPEYWRLVVDAVNHVTQHWTEAGHGIWEIDTTQRYLSSRVMCWTALDRALRIADRAGLHPVERPVWCAARAEIRRAIERDGWNEHVQAFTQALGSRALDASALLIPLTGFLPVDDPRVEATIARIAEHLAVDDAVYRFDPAEVPLGDAVPLGQYEAAFLPCTFWLAEVRLMQGRRQEAEDILAAAGRVAGPLGLYAEGLDPRGRTFAGNSPLLFSHVQHMRVVEAL